MNALRSRALERVALATLAVLVLATTVSAMQKFMQGRSAFLRWQPELLRLVDGEDVYRNDPPHPNPPVLALALYPLALLPPLAGALLWYVVKLALAVLALRFVLEVCTGRGPPLTAPAALLTVLLASRPVLSDLQHGNVNILILFLVMAGFRAYTRERDVRAGLWIALAASFKVTPALLIAYFAYKGSWRVVSAALLGAAAFAFAIPAAVLGVDGCITLLASYYDSMLSPYLVEGLSSISSASNQSLTATFQRWFTDVVAHSYEDGSELRLTLVALDPSTAAWIARGLIAALLALLAGVCRTPAGDRRDPRLPVEFALVLIAMPLVSPRSWKHHYVIMALPYACLVTAAIRESSRGARMAWISALVASSLLMLSTSKDLAGWAGPAGEGHRVALAAGAYLLSALVVFAALALRLLRMRESGRETVP